MNEFLWDWTGSSNCENTRQQFWLAEGQPAHRTLISRVAGPLRGGRLSGTLIFKASPPAFLQQTNSGRSDRQMQPDRPDNAEPLPTDQRLPHASGNGGNQTLLTCISVVIPARDEEGCIASTVEHLHLELRLHGVPHEIVVVDDGSSDSTWAILQEAAGRISELTPVQNTGPHGFGRAIQRGLKASQGDAVVIMMADESDDCRDVVRYWQKLNEGYDCVFGSRFVKGGGTIDYPTIKWVLNRCANLFVRLLFAIRLNDTTNAFKAYRREVIEGCAPILSPHFNITVELPLKAIVRGYSWTVIPITWRNRRTGLAKLKIREMGSRYFFIVAYVWLEKYFSRGDYRKVDGFIQESASRPRFAPLRPSQPASGGNQPGDDAHPHGASERV